MLFLSTGVKIYRSRPRQCHDCLESADRKVAQHERTSVGLNDIARDAQPEATAASVAIARGFQAIERLKHSFQLFFGNAWPVIADPDYERGAVLDTDGCLRAELDRVRDQIGQTAAQRLWLTEDGTVCLSLQGHRPAHFRKFGLQRSQHFVDVD